MTTIANYIDGAFVAPISGQYIDNYNPALGKVYSHIPDSDGQDVELALQAAKRAFPAWAALTRAERSAHLLRIADRIHEQLDALAMAESIDNGKPLWMSKRVDIPRASDNFRFFATAILHDHSELHDADGRYLNYTLRHPIGVAGCISPWNLPLYLFTWKIAPALSSRQYCGGQTIRSDANDGLPAIQDL
jgi:aminomuconate-semialdehyde/2-hydroxymuconate-6-semialdehyde dehydrogenase